MKLGFFALLSVYSLSAFTKNHEFKPGLLFSPDEHKKMHKQGMRKIKKVHMNKFGLKRINAERAKDGLPPLSIMEAKTIGSETEVDQNETVEDIMGATSTSEVSFGATALPSALDNSLLPSFPQIRNQGSLGSCVAWATGYYQQTHNNGLAMGWVNNNADNTTKCSPKFIYNQINSGVDNGSYFSAAYSILQSHGCVPFANLPYDTNYLAWDLNSTDWQMAINTRSNPVQYIYNVDTDLGLSQMKEILNNGYVLVMGTYINSWVYSTIKANPNAVSNPLVGQKVMTYMNGQNGGHAMAIVGYDDNAWTDINANNYVDDGELGVLKMANSFGTSWGNAGFMFITYDSLKSVSAVAGGPSAGRVAAFQSKMAYHQPVKAASGVQYKPKFLARVTLNHTARNQMGIKFGWSQTSTTTPTNTITPSGLNNKGGAYAFDGSTVAVNGTFTFDISELPISNTTSNRIYVTLSDNTSGSTASISKFEVIDVATNNVVALPLVSPYVADAGSKTIYLDMTTASYNQTPVARMVKTNGVAIAPLTVNFDGTSSTDADGTIATYRWNFGDGYTATGASVNHLYTTRGLYTATLTVTDDRGATSSTTTSIDTRDKVKPTVALTNPLNGTKFTYGTTVSIRATATDNIGIKKVNFYFNGVLICTDTLAPFSCSKTMPRGTNIPVRARAYDLDNNYTYSATSYISSY